VGELAEEQGHHPDLTLSWGMVDVVIFTHKIRGLSESDFVLGAKIDRLYFQGKRTTPIFRGLPSAPTAGDTKTIPETRA